MQRSPKKKGLSYHEYEEKLLQQKYQGEVKY